MRIRTDDGTEVPFGSVARAELARGFTTINRVVLCDDAGTVLATLGAGYGAHFLLDRASVEKQAGQPPPRQGQDGGLLLASDLHPARLRLLAQNSRRMGLGVGRVQAVVVVRVHRGSKDDLALVGQADRPPPPLPRVAQSRQQQ